MQPRLRFIPRSCHQFPLAVQADRGAHFLAHRVLHLLAEDVTQDAADEDRHEEDEDENKVSEQEEFHLSYGTKISKNCGYDADKGHRREHVDGPSE